MFTSWQRGGNHCMIHQVDEVEVRRNRGRGRFGSQVGASSGCWLPALSLYHPG